MLGDLELWVLPITLIPGIGLLIISSPQRYLSVYNKLEFSVNTNKEKSSDFLFGLLDSRKPLKASREYYEGQFKKMKLLKNAIISFYAAIVSLSFSSILTVAIPGTNISHQVGHMLIGFNVIFVTWGAMLIIWESRISDKFVRKKLDALLSSLEEEQ